jgi:phage terminase large subunit-like protein
MRAAARKLPNLKKRGRYTHARSADGSFAMHEWALEPEDDTSDMRLVKKVNPASWQTLEILGERHASPSMLPWQWARFACGIWVGAEAWWVSGEDWHQAATEERLEPGDRICLGFDGSRYGDATALVACRLEDGLLEPLGIWEQLPEQEGWEVPVGEVDKALSQAMDRFKVVRGYFDPPLWQTEIDQWAREFGETQVMRFHTSRSRMQGATERFRTDLVAGRVSHTGDEHLTKHVLNAQVRETRGGYWLAKARPGGTDRIDAAVAAVLAYEARADALSAGEGEERKPGQLVTF